MKKEDAINVLTRLISFLNHYKIPFHFSCGTLLGYFREDDLIKNDTDIDLNTYTPYITIIWELKDKLKDFGLYISRKQKGSKLLKSVKSWNARNVYGVKTKHANKEKYQWRLSFNGTNEGEKKEDNKTTYRWIDIYGTQWFPLIKPVSYKNINVFVPFECEKYLNFVYPNWRTPIERKKYIRPECAQMIYVSTTLFDSEYGKKFHDPKYKYIDIKECENFTTIQEFIQKYPFLKDIVNPTLQLIN